MTDFCKIAFVECSHYAGGRCTEKSGCPHKIKGSLFEDEKNAQVFEALINYNTRILANQKTILQKLNERYK